MDRKIKRIGILTSGGDAPGMNPAIRAVVRSCIYMGVECIGIRRGYSGLINGDVIPLDDKSVNGLVTRGGTILYTARCPEFMTDDGLQRAVKTCKYIGIDGVIAIGGDGTFRGARDLSVWGVPVMGIPGSIDNDIACTEYSIGFDTACNTAIEAIDRLRDTMQSHERCSVVEVMGRKAGHIALYVGIAAGATAVLVPEQELDLDRDVIEKIRRARLSGRTHFMIIVAEGVGSAVDVASYIREHTGLDPRVTVLGHVQRGGSPTARDRVTASRMGHYAVKCLLEGRVNRAIVTKNGDITDIDIEEAVEMKKGLQSSMVECLDTLTGV
jgi:6-phosphofructokinase 1